jgi:arginase
MPTDFHPRYSIIESPSILGLKSTGVDRLPSVLLENGVAEGLNARRAARLQPPSQKPGRDSETQTLNAQEIAAWSPRLADAVESVLDRGEFPLILGGDCSILLGSMLALKRRGRFGLLYIDAHADFYQPEAEPTGEAASMDLAFATGYGPELLTNIERRGPLVRLDDTVVFGFRDAEDQQRYGSQPLPADVLAFDLATVRRMGLENAMHAALERVARADIDGFFVHFDADSLHDAIMPAVDYRIDDGFTADEIIFVLQAALSNGRAVGMEVTVYNPALDPDGTAGRELSNILLAALGKSVSSIGSKKAGNAS